MTVQASGHAPAPSASPALVPFAAPAPARRGPDEFRAACGLASWSPEVLDASDWQPDPAPEPDAAGRLRAAWDRHRKKVLYGIAAAVLLSTAASFYESFSGLVGWFERLGFRGFRAVAAPGMVDLVGLAGEAIALVVIIEGRPGKVVRVLAWGAFSWGLVLSVVGNAGRDGFRPGLAGWFDMAWFAVPPLSLAIITSAALALAKLLLKPAAGAPSPDLEINRQSGRRDSVSGPQAAPEVTPAPPVQVTPAPVPGHPRVTPRPVRQVTSRRRAQATPGRISDADLKDQIRARLKADPGESLKAMAAGLGRGRDRVRPLLDEVRRERKGS